MAAISRRQIARAPVFPRSIVWLSMLMAFMFVGGCRKTPHDTDAASQSAAGSQDDPLRDENTSSWDIIVGTSLSSRRVSLHVPQHDRETALAVLRRMLQSHRLGSAYAPLSEKLDILQDADIVYVEKGQNWPRYGIYIYDTERLSAEIIRFKRDAMDPSKCRHLPVEAGIGCELEGKAAKDMFLFLSQTVKDKSPKAAQGLVNAANRCE